MSAAWDYAQLTRLAKELGGTSALMEGLRRAGIEYGQVIGYRQGLARGLSDGRLQGAAVVAGVVIVGGTIWHFRSDIADFAGPRVKAAGQKVRTLFHGAERDKLEEEPVPDQVSETDADEGLPGEGSPEANVPETAPRTQRDDQD